MAGSDFPDHGQLVKKAQRGDAKAFSQLYETIYKDLYRFAVYTLKDAHDAEDAVSEAVLLAYDKISALRNPSAFKSWMFQILSNQCRKKWKDQKRQQPEQDMKKFEQADFGDVASDLGIRETFSYLSEEEQLIVALSVFGGCNSSEIGGQLKLNAGTVRSKLSRALGKLRGFLEEGGEGK